MLSPLRLANDLSSHSTIPRVRCKTLALHALRVISLQITDRACLAFPRSGIQRLMVDEPYHNAQWLVLSL